MLVACSGVEAKFLVRGLQGKLRIGLAEKTVVASLAHAATLTQPGRVRVSWSVPGGHALFHFVFTTANQASKLSLSLSLFLCDVAARGGSREGQRSWRWV
jgi:hypothetical protein